jgi:hypothetical protein
MTLVGLPARIILVHCTQSLAKYSCLTQCNCGPQDFSPIQKCPLTTTLPHSLIESAVCLCWVGYRAGTWSSSCMSPKEPDCSWKPPAIDFTHCLRHVVYEAKHATIGQFLNPTGRSNWGPLDNDFSRIMPKLSNKRRGLDIHDTTFSFTYHIPDSFTIRKIHRNHLHLPVTMQLPTSLLLALAALSTVHQALAAPVAAPEADPGVASYSNYPPRVS